MGNHNYIVNSAFDRKIKTGRWMDSVKVTKRKRIVALLLILLLIIICIWRFWPHSLPQITSIDIESVSEIRGVASYAIIENGDLNVNTYKTVISRENECWDEILTLLTTSGYKQDLRNPFLSFMNKISFNSGRKDLSMILVLWDEKKNKGCELNFVSNNLICVTSLPTDASGWRLYHPTDRNMMDKLAWMIQQNGELVSNIPNE